MSYLNAEEYNIISLGENCTIPLLLQELELRKKSYPFDWEVHLYQQEKTNIYLHLDLITNLLKTKDYKDSTDKFLGKIPYQMKNKISLSNDPGFKNTFNVNFENLLWFPHESYENNPEEIKEKYERRFERLLNDINNKKNLFIIHSRFHLIEPTWLKSFKDIITEINSENKILCIFGTEPRDLFEKRKYEALQNHEKIMIKYLPYFNPQYKIPIDKRDEHLYDYDFDYHRPLIQNYFIDLFQLCKEKKEIDIFKNLEITNDMYKDQLKKNSENKKIIKNNKIEWLKKKGKIPPIFNSK